MYVCVWGGGGHWGRAEKDLRFLRSGTTLEAV